MIGIVYIVEKGLLEQQAILLQKSIEKYIAPFNSVKSFACCVRKQFTPSGKTVKLLEKHGATYLYKNLNQSFDYFPLCNGIYATSYIESTYPSLKGCLLVDTDTVFVNALNYQLFEEHSLLIRPVDNKGIGSFGKDDINDEFWQKAYGLFSEPLPQATMKTSIDRQQIRPYYNSGFIFAKKHLGFFNSWHDDFHRLMVSDIRTNTNASRHKVDYGFIEQMSISVTLSKLGFEPHVPSIKYNYPLPFRPRLQKRESQKVALGDLIHLHYHRWFQHPDFLAYIFSEEDKKSESFSWLESECNFVPKIYDSFKC